MRTCRHLHRRRVERLWREESSREMAMAMGIKHSLKKQMPHISLLSKTNDWAQKVLLLRWEKRWDLACLLLEGLAAFAQISCYV